MSNRDMLRELQQLHGRMQRNAFDAASTDQLGDLLARWQVEVAPETFTLVSSPCDCDEPGCYGTTDFKLFASEQTARQEADLRSKRYGGHRGRPDMHMERIEVSTKVSGF